MALELDLMNKLVNGKTENQQTVDRSQSYRWLCDEDFDLIYKLAQW
jgi:hypothetical protein